MTPRPFGARMVGDEDRRAEQNLARFDLNGVCGINLIGAPGSGKAALVRRTAEALAGRLRLAVVSTRPDPPRVSSNVPTVRLEVGRAPHLTAAQLGRGLGALDLRQLDLLIVENVGDFVCPATYRLGTHLNVRITTALEDARRPAAQPELFTGLDAVLLNKVDRMGSAGFDATVFDRGLALVNPNLVVMRLSCATGDGVAAWAEWLLRYRATRFFTRMAIAPDARRPPIAISPR